jgi:hypothetical protein
LATGGGTAISKAVATAGISNEQIGAANATSAAETGKGALAQAQSTATGSRGQAQSTAKTNFAGVSVQSTAVAPAGAQQFFSEVTVTTNAIAQGGAGQAFVNPGQTAYVFSTALPDKAYATNLIGGASHVASTLLGPARRGVRDGDPGRQLRSRWRRREPHLQRPPRRSISATAAICCSA